MKAWTEANHLLRWMCPAEFKVLFAENDLRIGGKWRSGMRSPEGEDFIHCGEYLESRNLRVLSLPTHGRATASNRERTRRSPWFSMKLAARPR